MISLVIYGLIAVALAASAGYAFLVLSNTSRQTTQLQENQVRMETAVASLRASALYLNGNAAPATGFLYAPMGVTGVAPNAYMQLPGQLNTVGSSPWGQPYLYCPVVAQAAGSGLTRTGTGTVKSPSGATYPVDLYNAGVTAGQDYVLATTGPNASAGYLAFIVSSLGPGQTVPDCSAILTAVAGVPLPNPRVPNGSVRGVTAAIPFTQRIIAATDRLEIYVGTDGTGTGNASGQDPQNLMPLGANPVNNIDAALSIWRALQPRLTEIYLNGGTTYTTTDNLDGETTNIPTAQGHNNSLIITTNPAAAANPATLTFNNALFLTANTTFQNVAITHSNTGGPAITAYKPLTLRRITESFNANTGINLYNTSLTVNSSTITGAAIGGSNSSIQFLNSDNNGAKTYTNTTIAGNQMRISFDDSGTYNFTESTNTPAITVTGGALNISGGTVGITGTSQGIVVSGGQLNIGGGAAVNINASEPAAYPASQVSGGIDLIDGSSGIIQSGGAVTVTGSVNLTTALLVRGSSLGLNGSVQGRTLATFVPPVSNPTNLTVYPSVINAQEATITGGGTISTNGQSGVVACLQILNQSSINPGPGNIPIYVVSPTGTVPTVGYASFAQSQYGYPLLLGLNLGFSATNVASNNAAGLINTTPYQNNPYVTIPPSGAAGNYTLGATTTQQQYFEAGVRTIVNREYIQGLHINFSGGCA